VKAVSLKSLYQTKIDQANKIAWQVQAQLVLAQTYFVKSDAERGTEIWLITQPVPTKSDWRSNTR
jgi:hypothetical protein